MRSRPELSDDRPRRRPAKPAADAYQQALGLLVRRERSRAELSRKLRERGVEPAEADATIDRLSGQGYQDDDRFAGALARTRAAAGYGPQRIRMELNQHGIRGQAQDAALDTCEVDWSASALDLLTRRYSPAQLDDRAVRHKALALLLRRGFDQETAYAAIDSLRRGG